MKHTFLRRFLNQSSASLNCFRKSSTDNYNLDVCDVKEKPSHIPVMVNEVVQHLNLKDGDVFLDMTFGAGGHSSALLQKIPRLKVIALDRDPLAQDFAYDLEKKYPNQVFPVLGKFSDLPSLIKKIGFKENSIDGMLFDLGCSSMQFDYSERGFSLNKNGPLDMRMGRHEPEQPTAADVLAYAEEDDLYQIFKIYGEEIKARKIARAVVQARSVFEPLRFTQDLSELVEIVCKDRPGKKIHVATKIFQAVRIFVNNEINELNYGLILAQKYLKPKGRAVAISFHSLEDKVVKKHFHNTFVDNCKAPLPVVFFNPSRSYSKEEMIKYNKNKWEPLSKKVILPREEEICDNPRSRSAKLRAAAKV